MTIQSSQDSSLSDVPPFHWSGGQQEFHVTGTRYNADTLHVVTPRSYRRPVPFAVSESPPLELMLVLPTLCITYADMAFANSIGGLQTDYPDSKDYSDYFDVPVVIDGSQQIEQLTWIRGAKHIVIARFETTIRWFLGHRLVIPRLRITNRERVRSTIIMPEMSIEISQPFNVDIFQTANSRDVGGIQIMKPHPQWQQPVENKEFAISVHAFQRNTPLPQAEVRLFSWDSSLVHWNDPLIGGYVPAQSSPWYTDREGSAVVGGLPCVGRSLLTVAFRDQEVARWEFLPFGGQTIRRTVSLP